MDMPSTHKNSYKTLSMSVVWKKTFFLDANTHQYFGKTYRTQSALFSRFFVKFGIISEELKWFLEKIDLGSLWFFGWKRNIPFNRKTPRSWAWEHQNIFSAPSKDYKNVD